MINDCSYVGLTILKYMPNNVDWHYIVRSRGFMDKTLGITYRILRARGDVYHVNYLLQDAYIAIKLGKGPLLAHAHGSDLRNTMNKRFMGRIVKYVLKHADKIVVSTPDILGIAKDYRADAMYIPNPVDTQIFYPPRGNTGKTGIEKDRLRVLIASNSDWNVKGTDIAVKALSRIKDRVDVFIIKYGRDLDRTIKLAKSLGLKVHLLDKAPHDLVREYYWMSDVVIDRFKLGSLGMVSLEAIASGRPVVTYVSSDFEEYRDFPLKDVNTEEEIAEAIENADFGLWKREYEYVMKYHEPLRVSGLFLKLYRELLSESK